MADTGANIIGRIKRGPFETVGRSESWAEQRNMTVNIVGKMMDLQGRVKPGDAMSSFPNWFDGSEGANMFVKTVDLTTPDGVTGEMQLALINCPEGKTRPYNITWDVSMEEVQMKLINHPSVLENCDIEVLIAWLDTPAGARVYNKNGKLTYRYLEYADNGNGGLTYEPKDVTGDWNVAFCNAVTQGVETYNKYLPVLTRNSYYLELPGVAYNVNHVITGGTITQFTGPKAIGKFSDPPINISGYTSGDGLWFKSVDKFTSQLDSTWVRTEAWVFTNDKRLRWIYTGTLDGDDSGDIGNWRLGRE